MKKIEELKQSGLWLAVSLLAMFGPVFLSMDAKAASLPDKLANDPVAKALGPDIMNAAIKEGKVVWYGSTGLEEFAKLTEKKFAQRFGIKLEAIPGRMSELTERIRAEHATGHKTADVFEGNDNYMFSVSEMGALEKFKPYAPELDKYDKKLFVTNPPGFFWPVHISPQALILNSDMVKKDAYPKSYWEIVDPKWKGRVAVRDPRSSAGGAWQFLQIYNHPNLGINYIKKLKEVVNPFILTGGSRQARDAVLLKQFALSFGGRPEFLVDAPKGSPLAYVVPKEGLSFTRNSLAVIKGAPHINAAKVLVSWFYEIENLRSWAADADRTVPHPDVKTPIPEMDTRNYQLMEPIPPEQLAKPKFFFKEMENIFK